MWQVSSCIEILNFTDNMTQLDKNDSNNDKLWKMMPTLNFMVYLNI
jgi:hypothetical protein